MIKNKNLKSANSMVWVDHWMEEVDPLNNVFDCLANFVSRLPNGKWKCEIKLPLINEIVSAVSSIQVDAIKEVMDKAAELIENYMLEHDELKVENVYLDDEYVFEENEDGELISIVLQSKNKNENKN